MNLSKTKVQKTIFAVMMIAVVNRSRAIQAQSEMSSEAALDDQLKRMERLVSLTVERNKDLEDQIKALRIQLGIKPGEPPLWDRASEMLALVNQAADAVGKKATIQELAQLRKEVEALDAYVESIETVSWQLATQHGVQDEIAVLKRIAQGISVDVDGLSTGVQKAYDNAMGVLATF